MRRKASIFDYSCLRWASRSHFSFFAENCEHWKTFALFWTAREKDGPRLQCQQLPWISLCWSARWCDNVECVGSSGRHGGRCQVLHGFGLRGGPRHGFHKRTCIPDVRLCAGQASWLYCSEHAQVCVAQKLWGQHNDSYNQTTKAVLLFAWHKDKEGYGMFLKHHFQPRKCSHDWQLMCSTEMIWPGCKSMYRVSEHGPGPHSFHTPGSINCPIPVWRIRSISLFQTFDPYVYIYKNI